MNATSGQRSPAPLCIHSPGNCQQFPGGPSTVRQSLKRERLSSTVHQCPSPPISFILLAFSRHRVVQLSIHPFSLVRRKKEICLTRERRVSHARTAAICLPVEQWPPGLGPFDFGKKNDAENASFSSFRGRFFLFSALSASFQGTPFVAFVPTPSTRAT